MCEIPTVRESAVLVLCSILKSSDNLQVRVCLLALSLSHSLSLSLSTSLSLYLSRERALSPSLSLSSLSLSLDLFIYSSIYLPKFTHFLFITNSHFQIKVLLSTRYQGSLKVLISEIELANYDKTRVEIFQSLKCLFGMFCI